MPSFFEQDPKNPYLLSGGQQLSQLLMSLGAGFSMAGANNQPWWAGIAPGAAMYGQAQQQAQQNALAMQQRDENLAYRKLQEEQMRAVIDERKAAIEARKNWKPMGLGSGGASSAPQQPPVGMGVQPPSPTMGGGQNIPQDYATRVAGYEGGTKNGGMVYNELGSGAGGPFQIMPATWADIRAKNPDLNLPETMPVDNRPETMAMHKAAFDRFTQGNAQVLQSAGIAPTSENLYLAHRFGAGGAARMLKADPNAMLSDVLPVEWQAQNPDMRGQTVGGFQRLATERMGGVGVPYRANGEVTQYQDGVPLTPPVTAPPPSITPVPQPQPVVPVQFSQPAPTYRQATNADLPPQFVAEVTDAVNKGFMSPEKGQAMLEQARQQVQQVYTHQDTQRLEQWKMDRQAWEKQQEEKRAEARKIEEEKRAANREGEWVRGKDGVERWVPKSERTSGMTRTDKPDKETAPGTPTGDIRILETGDPTTREYYAAHVRQRSRLIEGPDGQKYMPDMSAYRAPTFTPEGGAQPAPVPAGKPDATGLVPVGGNKAKIEDENKLRDDFERAPVVKQYRTVVPMLESAKDAVTRPTRAADINLVYAFAKLMDPESVVRESETGMVMATGTVGDRVNGLIGTLNGNQMLRDDTRKKLIAELESRFKPIEESYKVHDKAYRGIIERRGLNPDNVIIPTRNAPAGGDAPKPAPVRINLDGTPAK